MTTNSLQIAGAVLLIVFGGALAGLAIGRRLPQHHVGSETRAVVTVAMAVVGTMSALVLGLLISNANTTFNGRNADVARLSTQIVRLDTLLRRYGEAADPMRAGLRDYAARKYEDLFPGTAGVADGRKPRVFNETTRETLRDVEDRLLDLSPSDPRHRWLLAESLRSASAIADARDELTDQERNSLPLPFVGAVTLWLTLLFASFGLFAPRNATVLVALFCCAFAVSAAVKLVLDMDTPFAGRIRLVRPPIHLSSEPMEQALEAIRR